MRPDYSRVAEEYARARPGYPGELFEYLAGLVSRRDRAWDCATGSGQAAVALAEHFEQVIATDVSAEQLGQARAHPRVEYRVAPAEESGLAHASVDLVTVASAVHWFDLERFHAEAWRVLRPGGVLAVWTYHVGYAEGPVGQVFGAFYRDVVAPYFAEGARLVDARYEGIALPGEALPTPELFATVDWTLGQAIEFVRSWSGTQVYRERHGEDPVERIAPELAALWGVPESVKRVRYPLYMRVSRR